MNKGEGDVNYLAGAVMRSYEVPAVGVVLAGVTSLRALVDVPAPGPGGVLGVAGVAGAGEAAHSVGAEGVLPTVGRPLELEVVQLALVNVHTLGLVQTGVAHHTRHTVRVVAAAHLAVAADSVERVAVPVAAVVGGAEAKPGRVVWVLRDREILRVEAEIVSTPSPARPDTVLVRLTVTLALSTGLAGRAASLTTVVSLVPPSSRLEVTVILPTHMNTLQTQISAWRHMANQPQSILPKALSRAP